MQVAGTEITAARFEGKVALVTGAGSGIGRATALRLASEGASVACIDVSGKQEETASEIDGGGSKSVALACDVSDPDSVRNVVSEAVAALGAPSVVCNVAGIGKFTHTPDVSDEEWRRIMGVNIDGTFYMCRAVIPYLLDNGGNVVNVASTAGIIGQPYSAAYSASKGGVVMLTKALAVEYLERGIRFNAVCPGGVNTPILTDFMPPSDSSGPLLARLMTPMGFAAPEEVAGVIAFVASDECRYMNGSVTTLDGGITA